MFIKLSDPASGYGFLHPLAQPEKYHPQEHGDGVEYQWGNDFSDSRETFNISGDRHDNVYRSADTGDKKENAQYIKKDLHFISNLKE